MEKERKEQLQLKMQTAEKIFKQSVAGNAIKSDIEDTIDSLIKLSGGIGGETAVSAFKQQFMSPLETSWAEIDRKRAVFLSLFVRNSNILFLGSYGTGKTFMCKMLSDIAELNFTRIQGQVDMDKSAFSGTIDMKQLIEDNKVIISFPQGADDPASSLLLIDEINRMPPVEMSILTSVLAERLMEIEIKSGKQVESLNLSDHETRKGLMKDVSGMTVFATKNRDDEATFPVSSQILDRFALTVITEPPSSTLLETKHIADMMEKRILTKEDVSEIRNQVEAVTLPQEVRTYLELVLMQLQCGIMGEQREFCGQDACSQCANESTCACSFTENSYMPSARSMEQIIAFAKAHAYLEGRDTVSIEKDVNQFIFLNLSHKLKLKPDCEARIFNNPSLSEMVRRYANTVMTLPHHEIVKVVVQTATTQARQILPHVEKIRALCDASIIMGDKQAAKQLLDMLKDGLAISAIDKTSIHRWITSKMSFNRMLAGEYKDIKTGVRPEETASPICKRILDKQRGREKGQASEISPEKKALAVPPAL